MVPALIGLAYRVLRSLIQKGTGLVARSTSGPLRHRKRGQTSFAGFPVLRTNEVCPLLEQTLTSPRKLDFVFFISPNYLCGQGLRRRDKVQPPCRSVKGTAVVRQRQLAPVDLARLVMGVRMLLMVMAMVLDELAGTVRVLGGTFDAHRNAS
jgi:hypothetical protein